MLAGSDDSTSGGLAQNSAMPPSPVPGEATLVVGVAVANSDATGVPLEPPAPPFPWGAVMPVVGPPVLAGEQATTAMTTTNKSPREEMRAGTRTPITGMSLSTGCMLSASFVHIHDFQGYSATALSIPCMSSSELASYSPAVIGL